MADVSSPDAERPASLSGMISTLVPVAIVSAVYLAIFLVLRKSNRRYYAPRTYLGSLRESERSPPLPDGLFNWFGTFWKLPDVYALQHQSLDAFLYLRYLRIATIICFVGCCISWPVLFPVNATGGGGQQQLDILSYSNIDSKNGKNRYYAHCFVSWAFLGFVMYMIMRECIYYINLRQAFLLSPFYSDRISSRTVLFTSVPDAYLDAAKLRKVFGPSVRNVWITSNTDKVDELVKERDKVAMRLEKAEVKLIKLANKNRQAAIKKGSAGADADAEIPLDAESGSIAARWVPAKKRPTHKLGLLGLVGKKVDTINWCRAELERLIPAVEDVQARYRRGEFKKVPGVFIEFKSQGDAEGAAQVLAHHQGLQMTPKFVGIRPTEVVWSALSIPWWQRVIRTYAVYAFICALILFWAIPLAVVGAISNINSLTQISWLAWINKIPAVILGVVTGLLPAVLMSVLMSLVPVVMRLCAKLAGKPSLSQVELFTQNAYFAFLIIQVFLVTTLSSAATAVAKQIADSPMDAPSILANKLPKASNVYISYFIVQGLTIATGVLTQVVGFVVFKLLYKFLASTPRAMYNKWANLSAISWGSTLPVYTNIICIAIVYAGIAPLMLAWAMIAMGLFYLAWRYNIFFVTDTSIDTRGLIYPRALKQLFTGIYLAEVCMIGLFGASVAPGPLVLMVVFLVFTVLFHISLNSALDPLLYNLPLTLIAHEEETRLLPSGAGVHPITSAGTDGEKAMNGDGVPDGPAATATPRKGNFLVKFLKPWLYSDFETFRALVPRDFSLDAYPDEVARDAYFPPTVKASTPLLWIPADAAGVSKQEIAHTSKVIPITDEGCELDEKGKMVWDTETTRPPVWEEKIYW
ncbi:hypothetical protein QBC47DRAFT_389846 [Echria macrotheca]|uniref:DUF221-domain-containing protein n=1 Tax=Echria macrotheca TaxID=438768 RepID=A0AAJ0B6K1_9PEZI|nr:hypothetical protein QBC47DRAFT_389846 [Echria macrotheca]